ncbi:MAG: methylated-DNA--[protein]-cysteine S-methyltransferase [Fimbriimonas sp.]|nr:methylated-DNA--[protein]-cysteine S-methyltransferase [Fimbriimonas sp.]
MTYRCSVDSPVGRLYLAANDVALTELLFEDHRSEVDGTRLTIPPPTRMNAVLELVSEQLAEYFAGTRTEFEIPTQPNGTEFQLAVWRELQKISFGQTISYIELARRMGDEKKTRAVGLANGKNPISIIIPCHRVIGANGHLVGYGGGIENKRWLIDFEATDQLF